ncbi:hypothetical protein JTB14_027609 [Gonioctena quinquepunctata]|nr:hypothetical protein JTB14_027609 [Gonioctena quinquepunctata]
MGHKCVASDARQARRPGGEDCLSGVRAHCPAGPIFDPTRGKIMDSNKNENYEEGHQYNDDVDPSIRRSSLARTPPSRTKKVIGEVEVFWTPQTSVEDKEKKEDAGCGDETPEGIGKMFLDEELSKSPIFEHSARRNTHLEGKDDDVIYISNDTPIRETKRKRTDTPEETKSTIGRVKQIEKLKLEETAKMKVIRDN